MFPLAFAGHSLSNQSENLKDAFRIGFSYEFKKANILELFLSNTCEYMEMQHVFKEVLKQLP